MSSVVKICGRGQASHAHRDSPHARDFRREPFDDPEWLFEIKWDGYRAIAFIAKGKVRLVSRNQNELTAQYPELHNLAAFIKAETAILDGEIVALDEQDARRSA